MKIGDDERIKEYVIPPPHEGGRNMLPKKDVDYKKMKKSLFPDRPEHCNQVRNCYCGECLDYYDDEEKTCRKLGCWKQSWRPCRHGCCEKCHHDRLKEKWDCHPRMELIK